MKSPYRYLCAVLAVLVILLVAWQVFRHYFSAGHGVAAHYTKYEFRIPMRDGVKLFTSVYVPKDTSQGISVPDVAHALRRRAVWRRTITRRTRPGRNRSTRRASSSFIRTCAGAIMSEGTVRGRAAAHTNTSAAGETDESTDTYDTIDWLVKNVPNNNGKVGIWGISYPGFYAAVSMIDSHPALKAVSPQAPMADVVQRRRRLSQRGVLAGGEFRFLSRSSSRAAMPTVRQRSRASFDFGTADGTNSI